MPKQTYAKIIIIGEAGRGKSTLASIMSKKLDIPHYSTDDYFYEIKFTTRHDREQSIKDISKIYLREKWIVEGTTRHLLEPGLDSADLIIFLKYNSGIVQCYNLIKRHFVRKDESLIQTLKMMKHVVYKRYRLGYKKGKTTHAELISPHKHKVIELSSFKQIDDFVDSL
jgi:adenylate kinase family enzyme